MSSAKSWFGILGKVCLLSALLCAIGFLLFLGITWQVDGPVEASQQVARFIPAGDLSGGTDWLNCAKPLTLPDLRGRIVLLDFWTLCCINCMHVLPDLEKLEAKYPGILVILGIHTPKFPNEKLSASIQKAILRYHIRHPVVNDADYKIWRRYGVQSWPTLVLIDPDGNYRGQISGEGGFKILDDNIGLLAKEYRAKKTLKETPLNFDLIKEKETGPLNFPGKVLADARSNRLFIADSTNNRIVITDLAGKKIAVAGTGQVGFEDGPFAKARFNDPQGMALDGDTLYVADCKNHSIRALNLKDQTVKVAAGIGHQDFQNFAVGGPALRSALNSPWDLLLHRGKIYIAMAGQHQVWTFDPARGRVDPFAGNRREDIIDGPLPTSSFAQPSGLATDGTTLYVADAETSSIRSLPLSGQGVVKTIVGQGLFEFGDRTGTGDAVRLQHALGVAYRAGKLYLADTYNSKIKLLDPVTRTCSTFVGSGSPKMLFEPGGLSFAGDKLYVADTNNHRIQVIDMNTRQMTPLELQGVEPPRREKISASVRLTRMVIWMGLRHTRSQALLGNAISRSSASSQGPAMGRWPRIGRNNAKQSFARWRSQAELGNEEWFRVVVPVLQFSVWKDIRTMRFPALPLLGSCLLVLASVVHPTDAADPKVSGISFNLSVEPAGQVRPGQVFKLVIAGTVQKGYHTFALTAEQKNVWKLQLGPSDGLAALTGVTEIPSPVDLHTPDGDLGHFGSFTWVQEILVRPEAKPGLRVLPVKLRGSVCNDQTCLPRNTQFKVDVNVSAEAPLPVDPEIMKRIIDLSPPPTPQIVPQTAPGLTMDSTAPLSLPKQKSILNLIGFSQSEYSAALDDVAKQIVVENQSQVSNSMSGLGAFILAGIFWGAISLITPCVFPMIPITVSFFLKQSE